MKKTALLLAIFAIGGFILITDADARYRGGPGHHHGWGYGHGHGNGCQYDADNMQTLSGEVTEVETVTRNRNRNDYGPVYVTLKTAEETIAVNLGPSWFINDQNMKIKKGDTIKVTGIRATWRNQTEIIASTITMGEQTLTLRDDDGFPVWSRCGRYR